MKRFILLFLVYTFVDGKVVGLRELLSQVLPTLVHKRVVRVYTAPKYYYLFKKYPFLLVEDCNQSDIVFGNIACDAKPIFATNYYFYKKNPNVIAAFYYRKGRPQLKIRLQSYKNFFGNVPPSLQEFVE